MPEILLSLKHFVDECRLMWALYLAARAKAKRARILIERIRSAPALAAAIKDGTKLANDAHAAGADVLAVAKDVTGVSDAVKQAEAAK